METMMNTEAMHTPGPWGFQYTDESGECFVIAKNLGGMVGAALPWPSEIEARDFRRVVANARLIAAAPDLLAALMDLDEHGHTQAIWDRAKRAIAKATASPTGEAE
jgi:hypothetical protein